MKQKSKEPPLWLIAIVFLAAMAMPLIPEGWPLMAAFFASWTFGCWATKRYPLETKDSVDKQD